MCQRNARAPRRLTLTMLAAVAPLLGGRLFAQIIQVNQDDYYYNGSLVVPTSRYAELGLTYAPGAAVQYFNAVDVDTGQWIVQNEPLLTTHEVGTGSYSASQQFDLGVPDGTAVSSMNLHYVVGSSPLTSMPAPGGGGGSLTLNFGTLSGITNNGVPSGTITLGASGSPAAPVPGAAPFLTWHRNMYNVIQETNWCGPGAAANSINWLRDQNHFQLGQTPTDTEAELAVDMGNNHGGNWDDAEMSGKLEYILNHFLPLEVHYVGGKMAPTSGNYSTPFGNARNDGAITWDWIEREMAKGQDVELMTARHWVVVEGTYSNGSIKGLWFRDDPYQNGGTTTVAQSNVISSRHAWTYFNNGDVNFGGGNLPLLAAVAESPIKTLTALNFDPGNTSNNGIDPGTGTWDYSTNNFRGNGPGSTNTTWDDHCVAFGGGTNVCTISTGGTGVACDDLIVYGTCTIYSATAGDVCRMQNEAHIECVSGGQFNCNAVIAGTNGLLIDGDTASTQCNINSACTVSGKMTLNACQTTLGNNGTCQGITEIDCNRGATLLCNNFAVNNNDRINDFCEMHLNGGLCQFSASTTLHSSETCGPLVDGPCLSTINVFGTPAGYGVTFASLNHTTDGGFINVGGSQLAVNNNFLKFGVAPTLVNGIIPYVLVNAAAPAKYDATNGITAYQYTSTEIGNINSVPTTGNADPLTNANATPTKDLTLNSLTMGSGITMNCGAFNVSTTTGLMLHTGTSSSNNATISGTGSITNASAAGGDVTFYVANTNTSLPNAYTVNMTITDGFGGAVGSPVRVVIQGTGDTVLGAANTYHGGTVFGGGTGHITSDANLGDPSGPITLYGSGPLSGSSFDGTEAVDADVTTNRPIRGGGGAIRVADGHTYTINSTISDDNGFTTATVSHSIVLTSTTTTPASPDLNGKIILNGVSNLDPSFTVVLKDVNVELSNPAALGNATLKIASGNRAGTNNNVVKIIVDGEEHTLDNETYQNALAYYQGHPGLGTVDFSGYFKRENFNSTVGQVANANHTTLNLNAHALSYPGAIGLAAASGNINVFTANAWDGYLGNRNVDNEGVVSGPTTEPDASANTISWFNANHPSGMEYDYSQIFSAARSSNGGTSYPLTGYVDPNVTVRFLGNGNSGITAVFGDDFHKTGDGTMEELFTGNAGTAVETAGNSGNVYVDRGTLKLTVTANSAGQFPVNNNNSATGVNNALFDGGSVPIGGNGVVNYSFAPDTTFIADISGSSPQYLHFNVTINNGGNANSIATFSVLNQPLILGSAPLNAVNPVPATNWTGMLAKIGNGALIFDTSRIANIASGANLNILGGSVVVQGSGINDPFTSANNSVGVDMSGGTTLDISSQTAPTTVRRINGIGVLTIRNKCKLTLQPQRWVNTLSDVSLAGGTGNWTSTLDITNNQLYCSNIPFLQAVDQVKQGYNNGLWTFSDGISSSTAADVASDSNNPFKTGVGILGGLTVPAAPLGAPLGAPPPGTILIRYTYYGDANCDGSVNTLDFNSLAQNFNSTSQFWSNGDFNYDGVVNSLDFNALATNFGQVLASPPLGSVLPEPQIITFALLAMMIAGRRRRGSPPITD